MRQALKIFNNQALDMLKKSINATMAEAPRYINKAKENQKVMYENVTKLNNWYTKVIGLDEVKLYQDRVTSLQEQLLAMQEKRREAGRQLADVRQKSLELQDQIHKVKRQEDLDKFLDLMKQETEILRLENGIARTFQDYDQTEREIFTAFANAIRDSHEKQRAQIEYTKYFGLILSITGSFLAFMYSTIKKRDLKQFIEEKLGDKNTDPAILSLSSVCDVIAKEVVNQRQSLNQVITVVNSGYKSNIQTLPLNGLESNNVDLLRVAGALCLAYISLCIIVRVFSG